VGDRDRLAHLPLRSLRPATGREVEVLALLAEGLRNAQIGERLVVSERPSITMSRRSCASSACAPAVKPAPRRGASAPACESEPERQRRLTPIPQVTPDDVVTQAAPWMCAAADRGYAAGPATTLPGSAMKMASSTIHATTIATIT